MKIAIAHPTTWPQVRRGTERFINELAAYLAQRGHAVTVVSSKPGGGAVKRERGYATIYYRRLWHPLLLKVRILQGYPFMLACLRHFLQEPYDIVQCCSFGDAYAARLARRITGIPYVFLPNGLPPPPRPLQILRPAVTMFSRAIRDANATIAISKYVQRELERDGAHDAIHIPVPVDTKTFDLSTRRDHHRPVILCAAALDEARKGGRLLMQAFDAVKVIQPDLVLQVSGAVTEPRQRELLQLVTPRWRADVQFLGTGQLQHLPSVYGRAAISVLPSVCEPFGMVVLESLATGTPVVGTRDGALPELINDGEVGRLFDTGPSSAEPTNVDGLVRAIVAALDLSRRPDTARRCRAQAERFSWSAIGPQFESLYQRVAGRLSS